MPADPIRVLIVCTANQCRSPMAEVLAARAFRHAGIDADVTSAGVDATLGIPATEDAEFTVARLGLDLSSHASRNIRDVDLEGTDMIWCMERRHAVEVCNVSPQALPRTFTMLDLERRAAAHRHPSETLTHWLDRIGGDRQPGDWLGDSVDDDVPDPIGRSARQYRKTAERLAACIATIIEGVNPPLAGPDMPEPGNTSTRR